VEYIGQTRGWFYTLHVLATALFDRPSFTSCVSHGVVLGNDGRKMSKSLRNYPDVNEVFDSYGSDAMRWFLMASPILRGGNLVVTEQGIREGVRQALLPLWNSYYFLRAVRQRGELPGQQEDRQQERARPLHPRQDEDRGRGDRRAARRLRRRGRLPDAPRLPGTADQLVHPALQVAVLGRRPERARHAVDRPRDGDQGRRAAAADDRGDDLAGASPREPAFTSKTGRTCPAGRRTTPSPRPWT